MFEKLAMFILIAVVGVFGIAFAGAMLSAAPFLWIFVILFAGAIVWGVVSGLFGDSIKNSAAARKSVQHQDTRTGSAEDILAQLPPMEKGAKLRFGAYDWNVLAVEGDKALLLSENVIDKRPFHNDRQARGAIWAKCTLRRYLNGRFFNSTFSEGERALILDSELKNAEGATTDKVFPLSWEELKEYFPLEGKNWAARLAGVYCNWWLRDTKYSDAHIVECFLCQYETSYPGVRYTPSCVAEGVRPSMWIRIK